MKNQENENNLKELNKKIDHLENEKSSLIAGNEDLKKAILAIKNDTEGFNKKVNLN
jgi:hypothetical protein